jgi:hypothetical protein
MELVEGETLADRLRRGPMSIDEAVQTTRQLIDALEAAHERGIVHRDLKPANIKLTADGKAKVLDFGLAKLQTGGAAAAHTDISHSPTVTNESLPGVLLGTLAYMSPEQARGKPVDARTDIWAFGCVLYEMLTGQQLFEGETATDVIAHIVTKHPAWDRLPGDTPAPVRTLLEEALAKDPRERLQHIGDARLFLNAPVADSATPHTPVTRRAGGWLVAAVLGIGLLAALVPATLYFRRGSVDLPEMRFEMPAPGYVSGLSISPDGQHVAYVASAAGKELIFVRPIGAVAAEPLSDTENARAPFWSPDSRSPVDPRRCCAMRRSR